MVVEQKFKVLRKAEKEIYQNMNSNLREIEKNSAEFREFAENFRACCSPDVLLYLWYLGMCYTDTTRHIDSLPCAPPSNVYKISANKQKDHINIFIYL